MIRQHEDRQHEVGARRSASGARGGRPM